MVGWVVRTLLLCFVVGLVLSFLDINPASILTNSWATIQDIARLAADMFHWALPYILIGAVIVVPLSVIGAVMRWTRTRHRP
ncbi:hypothetical protein D9623_08655 [Azospirillum brasilense]|uniref:DUF6460 domain-containing protein n=2 Tax=Azospirillum TaxID=191 RepID=A0A9P1JR56_9PROT|nr:MULTISPECIES: DUF6460 domain-containing protein [Azospirillum]PWC87096.1 hypothetical protein AEJ54_25950 [Azospirillum sp. Sp 7]ALJ35309.1 hypothetical protein AMK58_07630 [Azospirillum brasilense]AWJ89813.1 hypothetical protein Sp245p_08490 [Azospirillum baldaniorum]NUB06382.1 hypothetical protein [Azospirillum baldaniorum]NUB16788.1 hypothetical protein [Azospirillum brasilense]